MTRGLWLPLAWTVTRKELKDAFRDKRSIYTLLFSALAGPAITAFMLNSIADRQRQIEEVRIPVVGMEHAPALMEWLRQQAGVEVVSGPTDPEVAVREKNEDVVVIIPADFGRKFRSSAPAQIKIVSDGSRNTSRPKVQRVRALLSRYNSEIGSLRLVARGISPVAAQPLLLEDVEVSSAQQRAATILNFIPLFIVLAAFTGGMQIATDSTAGERERGSLEPLLVNPAPRQAIVSGKWMAATIGAALSVVITTALCLAMLRFIPLQDLNLRFRLGPEQIGGTLAVVLPMCLLSAALQTYLATFARSFKEAQSYMGFLIMVPMLPGVLSALYPLNDRPWLYPIPFLGQHAVLADVLGGRSAGVSAFLIAGGASLVFAALLVHLTTQLFHRERIIFGR